MAIAMPYWHHGKKASSTPFKTLLKKIQQVKPNQIEKVYSHFRSKSCLNS